MQFRRSIVVLLMLSAAGQAARLSFRAYNRGDGLGAGEIHRIVRDSRGFLWFCSQSGLTFFDGSRFHAYHMASPRVLFPSVYDLLESDGYYWLATNSQGVWRVDPNLPLKSNRRITRFAVGDSAASNRVNALAKDRLGRLWAGSDGGLFRMDVMDGSRGFVRVELRHPSRAEDHLQIWTMLEDPEGSMWVGTKFGLARVLPTNQVIHYEFLPSPTTEHVYSILRDAQGRIWLGHQEGLIVFAPETAKTAAARGDAKLPIAYRCQISSAGETPMSLPLVPPAQAFWYRISINGKNEPFYSLIRGSDGHVWLGTANSGLVEFDGGRISIYGPDRGPAATYVTSLNEDAAGNIWIGGIGVTRLSRNGLTVYDSTDGLGKSSIMSISEDRHGTLYATDLTCQVSRFSREQWTTIQARLPTANTTSVFPRCRAGLVDHPGDWWLATPEGLFRFTGIRQLRDLTSHVPQVYRVADGLVSNDINSIYEDSRGDIWIGYFTNSPTTVTRWERRSATFHHYSETNGLPSRASVEVFGEDLSGNLWIGFRGGGLWRHREGQFDRIPLRSWDNPGWIKAIFTDHTGRLWLGLESTGILRIDDPRSDRPGKVTQVFGDGLTVRGIAEDRFGRIYATTPVGITRIDPTTGRVRHYGDREGLSSFEILGALTDRDGALWFGASGAMLRLTANRDPDPVAPPVFISGLTIGGLPHPVGDLGTREIRGLSLRPDQRHVRIEFFALAFGGGGPLRYQHRIGNGTDWSTASEQNAVDFANLASGSYEFAVRALDADGAISTAAPATVSFTIAAPLWRRWWALTLAAMVVAATIYVLHRRSLARVLELERVRTRIATDLHDDIGSTLSQITVLSEVIRQRVGRDPSLSEPLSAISSLSRDLIDSLSDIVWAINPLRDRFGDLTQRTRQFANDLFAGRPVELQFQASLAQNDLRMGADTRREVFLIFKEGMNNISRHSNCRRVDIEFRANEGKLQMTLTDDGQGFDCTATCNGNGLSNMRQRAAKLGGTLTVTSDRKEGTVIRLMVPVR